MVLFMSANLAHLTSQCNQIYNWTEWQTFTGTSATGTINNSGQMIGVTMNANYSFNSTPGIYNYGAFNGFPGNMAPNTTVPRTTWTAGTGGETTMCFSEPVTNPVLLIASLGNGGQHVTLQFSLPYAVVFNGGGMNFINTTTIYGYEGYAVLVFPGTFTCVTIFSSTPEYYTNITWGLNPPLFPVEIAGDSIACDSVRLLASGGSSYSWSGGSTPDMASNTFFESGTYFLTVTDNNNCVVQTSVNVMVGKDSYDTLQVLLCRGENYNFEGEVLSESGTYQKVIPNAASCDSIITLHLDVFPNFDITMDTFICQGSRVEFQGDIWEPDKIYTYQNNSQNGCDSIVRYQVFGHPSYYRTRDTTICMGTGFQLDDRWITGAGQYLQTLKTSMGCDSIWQIDVITEECRCCIPFDSSQTKESLLNTFYPVAYNVNAAAGSTEIKLDAVPDKDIYGTSYGSTPIKTGDIVLIIQMQGANFSPENNPRYGSGESLGAPDGMGGTGYTNLQNAGIYEYAFAQNDVPLTGGILKFHTSCFNGGLKWSYENGAENDPSGRKRFQVVRVPQYKSFVLQNKIVSTAWNGRIGGIVALNILDTLDLNGYGIDASRTGFRGGFVPMKPSGNSIYDHATNNSGLSGGKGEGICGTPRYVWNGINEVDYGPQWIGYQNGNFGKGAPGNAGGGGNSHNAGGGGGGLGGFGGNGGKAYGGAGNNLGTGGRPGSPLNPESDRLFPGGGGGGGDVNNTPNGNKGGTGGGIILIQAGMVKGNGYMSANGGDGDSGNIDGGGGGGSGGSISLATSKIDADSKLQLSANGGKGGNTINGFTDHHGPGGGGGGGMIFSSIVHPGLNTEVKGGVSGRSLGNGISHGAAPGEDGLIINQSGPRIFSYFPKPQALFSAQQACQNEPVMIENFSHVNNAYNSEITSFIWSTSDGQQSLDKQPTFVFNSAGEYTIKLIVITNHNCKDTLHQKIRVSGPKTALIELSSCDPIEWNSISCHTTGIYPFATESAAGCDSTAVLSFTLLNRDTIAESVKACQSYIWNGKNYTVSGNYEYISTNVKGCDSVNILKLQILKPAFSNLNVTSCDSYTWKGEILTASGVYTFDTINAGGCDSTINLNLNLLKSTTSETIISSCAGFTWNGNTYNQSGIFTYKTINAAGCDSTAILRLILLQSSTSETDVTSCDSYTWNNTTYTQSGMYTFTTTNSSGCDSAATLRLTIRKSSGSQLDISSCDSYIWNGNTYTQSGSYTYTLNNANGCDSIARLKLTIYPSAHTTLSAKSCSEYFWKDKTYTTSGSYAYNANTVYGCDSVIILQLTILPKDTIIEEITSCGDFIWSGNKKLYNQSGQYIQRLFNIYGCDSVHILNLTLYPEYLYIDSVDAIDEYSWDKNGKIYTFSTRDSLSGISTAGCDSLWLLKLNLKYSKKLFVPNIITPGQSGKNQYFTVYGNQSLSMIENLKVFDRWGNLVYEGRNIPPGTPETGWDGSFRGISVAEAVYLFMAYVRFTDNTFETISGDVTVVK